MSTETNHWWWKAQKYRVNQVKEVASTGRTIDAFLLGDSIIHYWDGEKNQGSWKRAFSGKGRAKYLGLNLAIEGDRTETLLWRVENGLFPDNGPLPRAVIILIGTNNTGTRSAEKETPDDTAAGVKAVVEAVRKRTRGVSKILLFGLLPRGSGTNNTATVRNRLVNERLKKLDERKGRRCVFYRDIGDLFLNDDGTVNTSLLGDRLHPSKEGYELLAREFTAALDEAIGDPTVNDISGYWSERAWRAYKNFDPDGIRAAKAEIDKAGGRYGYYSAQWTSTLKMFEDYDHFPRAEEDIVFPKSLKDLGFRDTKVIHANEKKFAGGWNPTNCTAAIQAAIDSDSTTVVIDKAPGPWYIDGIRLKSDMRLLIKKGARLMMDKTSPLRGKQPLIRVSNVKDVIIEGEGSEPGESLVAAYASYDERKVWCKNYGSSLICLQQTENVAIRNIRLAESEEDGIVFSSVGGSGVPSLNTYVENVVIDSHYRQAMSVCSADGVFCRNVSFLNTRGNAPSAGIDFEPPYEVTPNTGIYLFDCTFENNGGGGLMFATSTFAPMTLYAKRTRFLRHRAPLINFLPRIGIYMAAQKRIPSKFIFEDCEFESYQDSPIVQGSCGPMFTSVFRNCRMKSLPVKANPRRKYLASPICFALNRDFGRKGLPPQMVGVTTFENVTWEGPEGVEPVGMCDELCRLDIRGALKGAITMNGKKCVLDNYEYIAPDACGRVEPEVPVALESLLPPAKATPKNADIHVPCNLSWDGAWWMTKSQYSYLFHAKKGGKVSFSVTYPGWQKKVAGKPVEIEGADGGKTTAGTYTNGTASCSFTAPADGWYRLMPPMQGPTTVADVRGARFAYQGDTKDLFLTKFYPRDGEKEYIAYFEVPAGGRECRIRMSWGSIELRDPAGNIVERVKQGEYLGNHVFTIRPSSDKAEIWSMRSRGGIAVLRFYAPLTGVWADTPEDLPCQFAEHYVPMEVESSKLKVESPDGPSTLQPINSSTSQSGSAFPADPDWGDPLPAFDANVPHIDRATLSPEEIDALDKEVAARKAFGEGHEWAERFAAEKARLDEMAKKATTDGERHDVEMASLNLPALERMAAMEARAAQETDAVRELAAYCGIKMRVLAKEDDDLERELRALHLGLIRGTTLEYTEPVLLLPLRDAIAERQTKPQGAADNREQITDNR